MVDEIQASFEQALAVISHVGETEYLNAIRSAVVVMTTALRSGRKIVVFGNGGSASDAQHIAGELVGRFRTNRRPLPAIALAADAAVLTCIANDFSYRDVFSRQIQALAMPGDVAWGISTTGNSQNVIAGLQAAREIRAATVLMTGKGGGKARAYADIVLDVPASDTAHIQEVHMITYHAICAAIETDLFPRTESQQECAISIK